MEKKEPIIVEASLSKKNARVFNYGNIVAVMIPFPFFIFWFGASMFVYAMYRHHPNVHVGNYTQRAAYYFYSLAGLLVPVLTFASKDFFQSYWYLLWGLCALVIIPLSIWEIIKINSDDWKDIEFTG